MPAATTLLLGDLKPLRLRHEPDQVGTRCPASALGFRFWTRSSASLPPISFTALGGPWLLRTSSRAVVDGKNMALIHCRVLLNRRKRAWFVSPESCWLS